MSEDMNPGMAAYVLSQIIRAGQNHRGTVHLDDADMNALTFAYSWLQNVANQEIPISQDD